MANPSQSSSGSALRVFVLNRRALLSLVLLVSVVWLNMSNTFWRWVYPISYQDTIQSSASSTHVDPLLVASVIHVESKYKTKDVSHAGAIGLMQLMPNSAQWIAEKMSTSGTHLSYNASSQNSDLSRPDLNIKLGCWYIRYLTDKFHGNQVAAIAAYNAGPKRVTKWLQDGTWNGQLETINSIPVSETRHYVDRVFFNYDLYTSIYGLEAQWQNRSK